MHGAPRTRAYAWAQELRLSSIFRVERESTIDQRHHGADVLAEIGQRKSGVYQGERIVARDFECSPGKIDALQTVRRRIFAPIVTKGTS